MNKSRMRTATRLTMQALIGCALVVGVSASAAAQKRGTPVAIEGSVPGERYVAPRNGFDLFANADLAASGMRSAANFYWAVSNIGPCADGHVLYGDGFGCGGFGGTGAGVFEVVLAAGVPISDFRKIRAVYQGVNNHLGTQGFTQMSSHLRVGAGSQDWGPADNTFGRLFKGETSTNDGTCRDNTQRSNNFMGTNVTLLSGSDCPATWASTGFDGPRPLTDSSFIKLKARQGSAAFTFDYFRVPDSDKDNSKFLGSFSTYGKISDHFDEALQSYGSVTPKYTSRKPARNGFPIGLDVTFQAYTFNRPQIANAVFWQMIVVNNSKDVYGTGIDYDSLYMGVMNGIAISGDQQPSQYAQPHRNAIFAVRSGVNIGCNGATPNLPGVGGCNNQGFRNSQGFGIVMLKSPIGDTRNKLLTRPGPFYDPTSPYADDTITFNHHHQCGFGLNCFSSTMGLNDRRGFGMISSTEQNVLDGRDPGSLSAAQQWVTFRPKAHPAQPNAVFNRYVPGTWSYENKVRAAGLTPAQRQDTIFFDDCSGTGFINVANQNGGRPLPSCSVAFSDTMPGKQTASGPGNVGGVMTAGPFPLKAGDTTSFIISWYAARDSAGFEALTNAITDSYLSFFLGPDAPPAPRIAAVQVASAEERDSLALQPFVRLIFTDEPETFVDPFFARYYLDLKSSQDPFFKRMRNINPTLADTVLKISQNNFAELYIFRSCNNGLTFSSRTDCVTDRTIGPNGTIGLGYRPYAILRADINGNIPNTFTDNAVLPGISYLYSLVPRSRGLTIAIQDLDPTDNSAACAADTTFAACKKIQRIFTVADTASASIATSGPSVARVYVPVSVPAGGRHASTLVTSRAGTATVPVRITLTGNATSGDYRLIFGNRFIIQQTTNTVTNATTSVVRVQDVIATGVRSGVNVTDFVENETVLSGPGPLDFTGFTYTPQISTNPGTRFEADTAIGLGFVLAQGSRPLYVSLSVVDTGITPTTPESFTRRSDFPGFLVSVNQLTADSLKLERIVTPAGDSVAILLMNSNSLQFRQENSQRVNARGQYSFTFADDAFGHGGPFIATGTAEQVGPRFTSSIANRNTATVGDVSARIGAIVSGTSATVGGALRPIKFPFSVTSKTGNPIILAAAARTIAAASTVNGITVTVPATTNTFLLGNGSDTVRVAVDSLSWLPGDPFVVLEVVANDSVIGGRVVIDPATGKRLTQLDTVVAFLPTVLGCNSPRTACNPVKFPGPGATGFLPFAANTKLVIDYPLPFTLASDIDVRVNAANPLAGFTGRSLSKVRVVPNPYVVQSLYDEVDGQGNGEPRLMFTGLPGRGSLRIYSISGQFLQQLSWTAGDLEGETSGDLKWNLRTREGTIVASGLYIYVLTANDERGKQVTARGKFVVIR